MMRRTRSQMKIDFPAQKSSRSRSKLLDDVTVNVKSSRRHSLAVDSKINQDERKDLSYIIAAPVSKKSPAKRRMKFDGDDENASPVKKRNTSGDPIPPSPLVSAVSQHIRVPLSPRNNIPQRLVPNGIASPKSARALTFSPSKCNENCATPEAPNLKSITKGRALTFSPVKSSPKKQPIVPSTPTKFTALRGCESPVKSPMKTNILRSPMKSGIASPVKKLNLLSPVSCRSPVKRLGLESPRKDAHSSLRLARQESVCYQKAKQAFHTALPEKLLCREKEYKEVNDFLDGHLMKQKSGSLYISGAPGTGKTAVLSKTLNKLQDSKKFPVIYINCMSFKNSTAIYNRVLGDLIGKETRYNAKDATKELEKALCSQKTMVVLILDEVDQLDNKNQDVLYTMFEWPALEKSKLVLIGIANALDLTDRILPRLQSRPKCKPQLMNFAPYTRDQLVAVLKDRLSRVEVNGEQVMDPAAIQFCARKVASQAGDMRKALDVCRRAVEMVEAEVRKQQILQGCKSPSKKPSVPKKIGVAHILKIINEVYGNRVQQSGESQTIPLQQKLAICTLLLLRKRGKFKEVTLGKLHESFCKICEQQKVAGVDQGEFHAMCNLIEARGIMALKKAKDTRNVKVTLKLDEKELEVALQDKTLVSAILAKGLP